MPNYTKNLNLILPDKNENYDVDIANTNNKIIDEEINNRVEKIPGKGLSTHDFTNNYKNKLDKLISGNNELQEKNIDLYEWDGKSSEEDETVLTLFNEIMDLVNNGKTIILIVKMSYLNNEEDPYDPIIFVLYKEALLSTGGRTFVFFGIPNNSVYGNIYLTYSVSKELVNVEYDSGILNHILYTSSKDDTNYFKATKKSQPVSKGFLDEQLGDLGAILDIVNGEVV